MAVNDIMLRIQAFDGKKYTLCDEFYNPIESFDTYPEAQSAAERLARKRKK